MIFSFIYGHMPGYGHLKTFLNIPINIVKWKTFDTDFDFKELSKNVRKDIRSRV